MAVNEFKRHHLLIRALILLLLLSALTACIAPDEPMVLSSEGDAVAEGEVVGGAPAEGEAPPVEVEEADVAALATAEPEEEAAEDATGNTATTPEGVAEVPEEGAAAEEGLAAEIGFTDALVSANYLINRDVEDLDGNVIADVDDLLIDLETGRILYLIVNYGDFLDLTDEDRPLPLSAFGWNQELELVLRLPEDVLGSVPAVEDEWPADDGTEWGSEILPFWQEAGFAAEGDAVPVRVTQLIGLHAGQIGSDLGVVEDFLLDLNRQQVAYLGIFTTDGFYSPDLVLLVPLSAADLEIEVVGDEAVYGITLLEVEPEILRDAPAIERAIFSTVDFIDQEFAQELNGYWNEQGYEVGIAQ